MKTTVKLQLGETVLEGTVKAYSLAVGESAKVEPEDLHGFLTKSIVQMSASDEIFILLVRR